MKSPVGKQHFHILLTALADLVKLHSELSSTFQRCGERIQVLTPEGKEFLNAQAAQRVVAGVANAVLLAHGHHFVVHVQGVLLGGKARSAVRCSVSSLKLPLISQD